MLNREEISNDLKELIVAVHPSGSNWKTISKQFDVHHCAVRRIIHKWKTLKTTDSLPRSVENACEQTSRLLQQSGDIWL